MVQQVKTTLCMHAQWMHAIREDRSKKLVFFLVCMQPISNAKTNFFSNNQQITKTMLWMLTDPLTRRLSCYLVWLIVVLSHKIKCSVVVCLPMYLNWCTAVDWQLSLRESRTQGRKEENSIMWFYTDGLLYFHSDLHALRCLAECNSCKKVVNIHVYFWLDWLFVP